MDTRPIDLAIKWAKELGMNQSQLARALDVVPQDITNWKARGMPLEWLAKVALVLGRSADELLGLDAKTPPLTGGVTNPLSLNLFTVAPKVINWERLMEIDKGALPARFETTAPDEALFPRLRAGQSVTFDSTLEPRPGDCVLISDKAGGLHLRVYRQGVGSWQAAALNDNYLSFDSATDGLSALAVLVNVEARWG